MHSNTICIVSLAFGHEILTKGKKCVKVEFGVELCFEDNCIEES